MNKNHSVIILVLIPIILILTSVIGLVCTGIYSLKYEGVIPPEDKSARKSPYYSINNEITWKGKTYILCDYDFNYDAAFDIGKAVTQCGEGGDILFEVNGDSQHHFLIDTSFNERPDLYVSADYTIPTEGKLTSVYVNGRKVTNKKLLDAIEQLYSSDNNDFFLYKVEDNFHHDHNIVAKKINLAYEGCPVGSDYKGYLGRVDGKWCYFHDYPGYRVFQKETIPCFEIDEELIPIINNYF